MKKFTKTQAEAAKTLAVAYSAYNEARRERQAATTRDEKLSTRNNEVFWGGMILNTQNETGIVLVEDIAIWHERDKAVFAEEGGQEWLDARIAQQRKEAA